MPLFGGVSLGTALIAGGSIGGGLLSGIFGQQGAQQQADALKYAANLQDQRFKQFAVPALQPFVGAGQGAAGSLANYLGINGQPAQQNALNAYSSGPFMQDWVNTANRNTALAGAAQGGGALSGNVLNALYQQNAGMWQGQYNTFLQQLAGLSGQGVGAAGALAGVGTTSAAQQGAFTGQAGAALGAGTAGLGNALGGALNNAGIFGMLGYNNANQLPASYNTPDYA